MTAIFVNTGLDSPLEILYNANTHVPRNRANEACHIPLQLINCSWLIKVHIIFTITPQKEVQRVQVRGVRGPDVRGFEADDPIFEVIFQAEPAF